MTKIVKQKESWEQEVARLQHEIAVRQARLQQLICGDLSVCVGVPITPAYKTLYNAGTFCVKDFR